MSSEKCIRCGKETKYDVSAPVNMRKYYIEGSGQLCEQCFSQLYPTATASLTFGSTFPAPSDTPALREQEKREDQEEQEQIKMIKLPSPTIPTPADQERYNQLINKPTLTDADREELKRLYQKYTD